MRTQSHVLIQETLHKMPPIHP
jgi:hypothetical protein